MAITFESGVVQHPFRDGDFVTPGDNNPYFDVLKCGEPYQVLAAGATAICLLIPSGISVFKAQYFRPCEAQPAHNAADEYNDIIAAQDLMEQSNGSL